MQLLFTLLLLLLLLLGSASSVSLSKSFLHQQGVGEGDGKGLERIVGSCRLAREAHGIRELRDRHDSQGMQGQQVVSPTFQSVRKWPKPEDALMAIPLLLGGFTSRQLERLTLHWPSFVDSLLTDPANVAVIFVDVESNVTVQDVAAKLHLTPTTAEVVGAECAPMLASLDMGYVLYHALPSSEAPKHLQALPVPVLVGMVKQQAPQWVLDTGKQNKDMAEWSTEADKCWPAPYAYVQSTQWYTSGLFHAKVMRLFDFWAKVDTDIAFTKAIPSLSGKLIEAGAYVFKATDLDYASVGPGFTQCSAGVKSCTASFMTSMRQAQGAQQLKPVASGNAWFDVESRHWYSNFIGGWLGLYASPQALSYSKHWQACPNAWTHRWTDQEYWDQVTGLYASNKHVLDLSSLREHLLGYTDVVVFHTGMSGKHRIHLGNKHYGEEAHVA